MLTNVILLDDFNSPNYPIKSLTKICVFKNNMFR